MLSKIVDFAGTDAPLNADERFVADGALLTFPTIIAAIGIAYGPSLPAGLVIPRTMLVRMFGPGADVRLPFWNDPEMLQANPALASRLPAARMVLVARTGTSGTTEAFKIGMKKIGGAAYKGDVKDTATWAVNPSDLVFPGSTPLSVLTYVSQNPYTFGIASQADINTVPSLSVFRIINTSGKLVSSMNLDHVSHAASRAIIGQDLSLDTLDTDPAGLAWPLTIPTYVLIEVTTSQSSCDVHKHMTRFWLWTQTNPLAIEVAASVGVTTPFKVLSKVIALLDLGTFCNNGDLASEGIGHAAFPISTNVIRPLSRLRTAYNDINSHQQLVIDAEPGLAPSKLFLDGSANFALVDSPIGEAEAAAGAEGGMIQVPFMTTGIVVAYNITALVGVVRADGSPLGPLILSPATLAGIFAGNITAWNDPSILRDNVAALLYLPAKPIVVIVPETSSSVTREFTVALAASGKYFAPGVSPDPAWPPSFLAVATNFSDALTRLAAYDNSITFAPSAALPAQPTFVVASSRTPLGDNVLPSVGSFKIAHQAALGGEKALPSLKAGQAVPISLMPVAGAWPLMITTYLVARQVVTADCIAHAWDVSVAYWLLEGKESAKAIASLDMFNLVPPEIRGHILLELGEKISCNGNAVMPLYGDNSTCPVVRGMLCGGPTSGKCAVTAGGASTACVCEPKLRGEDCQQAAPPPTDLRLRNIVIGAAVGVFVILVALVVWAQKRRASLRPPIWMVKRSDFTLDELIARGGYSLVFRATWKNTDVSAKVIRLPSKKRGNVIETAAGIDLGSVLLETDPCYSALIAQGAGSLSPQQTVQLLNSTSFISRPPLAAKEKASPARFAKGQGQQPPHQIQRERSTGLPGQVASEALVVVASSSKLEHAEKSAVGSTSVLIPKDHVRTKKPTRISSILSKFGYRRNAASAGLPSSGPQGDKISASARNELETIAKLRHPNVAFLIAAAFDRGYLYILLEFMDAGSLYDVLRNEILDLGPSVRANLALDAAKGLLFLHSQSPPVLHRDIKSPNILVDSRFAAKVTDFGLSSMTDSVAKQGTLPWSAPEVIRGEVYTLKSDVYSFGLLLWELQCARAATPWARCSAEEVKRAVEDGKRPDITDSPDNMMGLEYARLVKQCWAQSPDERPTMAAVVAKLEEIKASAVSLEQALSKDGRRQLLHLELPHSMREDIMAGREVTPVPLDNVTLIFTDIVGFTNWSSSHTAEEVTAMLAELHDGLFASICVEHSVHHLETIGDAFIAVTNFPRESTPEESALSAVRAGFAMIEAAKSIGMSIRAGIASGPAVATIVGKVSPKLTLLGDTVNLASRLETSAPPDTVQVNQIAYQAVRKAPGIFVKESKLVELKGKGPTRTYVLAQKKAGEGGGKPMARLLSSDSIAEERE